MRHHVVTVPDKMAIMISLITGTRQSPVPVTLAVQHCDHPNRCSQNALVQITDWGWHDLNDRKVWKIAGFATNTAGCLVGKRIEGVISTATGTGWLDIVTR